MFTTFIWYPKWVSEWVSEWVTVSEWVRVSEWVSDVGADVKSSALYGWNYGSTIHIVNVKTKFPLRVTYLMLG